MSQAKRALASILALGWIAVCSDQAGYIAGRYAISGFPLILLVIGSLAIAFAPLIWILWSGWRQRRSSLQHSVSQRVRDRRPLAVDELVAPLIDGGDEAWIEFLRIRGVGQSSLDPS